MRRYKKPRNPLPQVGEIYEVAPDSQGKFSIIVTHVTTGDPIRIFYKFPEDWQPETLQYAYSFATRIDLWEQTAKTRRLVGTTTDPAALKFIPFYPKAVNDRPQE